MATIALSVPTLARLKGVTALTELEDDLHGRVTVRAELLDDLLSSAAVQRLRGVSQAGASSLVRNGRTVTRFEHSVGVMALTARLGGNELEQAAGLLQDVSHTAFSHTVDYVFGDRSEAFHERIFASVVEQSDVPKILKHHALTWSDLFRPDNLRLVDVPAPLLCADRIDYTLRDLRRLGYLSLSDVTEFLDSLVYHDNSIVVSGLVCATNFAEWYRYLVREVFMHPLELYAHDELARILREGLSRSLVDELDLLGTDSALVEKILSVPSLRTSFLQLKETRTVVRGPHSEARRVYSKARVIDPPVLTNGGVRRLSDLEPATSTMWSSILSCGADGILVRPVAQN